MVTDNDCCCEHMKEIMIFGSRVGSGQLRLSGMASDRRIRRTPRSIQVQVGTTNLGCGAAACATPPGSIRVLASV